MEEYTNKTHHEVVEHGEHGEVPTQACRIYAASLSDYNAGILHGAWINADTTADNASAAISEMLARSPTTRMTGEPAEEWAIHDYEGFGRVRLGEYDSLERVTALARGIQRHGNAFAYWWDAAEPDNVDAAELDSAFEDTYLGSYQSAEDYGESLLDDMGIQIDSIPGVPAELSAYVRIDVAGWTRDLQLSGDISFYEDEGVTHVFKNH